MNRGLISLVVIFEHPLCYKIILQYKYVLVCVSSLKWAGPRGFALVYSTSKTQKLNKNLDQNMKQSS